MNRPVPRFQIVPNGAAPVRGRGLWLLIAVVWLLSLAGTWWLASRQAAPALGSVRAQLHAAEASCRRSSARSTR
jgi:hypothetical protein